MNDLRIDIDVSSLIDLTNAIGQMETALENALSPVRDLSNRLKSLDDSSEEAAEEIKKTNKEAKDAATKGLKDLDRAVKNVDGSTGKMSGSLMNFTNILENAKKAYEIFAAVARAAIDFLKAAVDDLVESNQNIAKSLEDATQAAKDLRMNVLGLIGSETELQGIFNLVKITLEEINKEIVSLTDNNGTLISQNGGVESSFNAIMQAAKTLAQTIVGLKLALDVMAAPTNTIRELLLVVMNLMATMASVTIGQFVRALSGMVGAASSVARAVGADGMADAMDSARDSINDVVLSIDSFTSSSNDRLVGSLDNVGTGVRNVVNAWGVFKSLTEASDRIIDGVNDRMEEATSIFANFQTQTNATTQSYINLIRVLAGDSALLREVEERLNNINNQSSTSVQRSVEVTTEENTLTPEEQAEKAAGALARLQQQNEIIKNQMAEATRAAEEQARINEEKALAELERLQQVNELRKQELETQEALAEQERQRNEEMKKMAPIMDAAKNATSGLAGGFASAIGSGEDLGETSKKLVGDMITSLGQSAIAAGAVALIGDPTTGWFPNPAKGAGLIAAGSAAVALGSSLGASGGGGGGTKSSAASSSSPNPRFDLPVDFDQRQSQMNNQQQSGTTVNFNGVVGDPREVAKQIQKVQQTGSRSGI